MADEQVERFHPTSGRFTGVLALVLAAVFVVVGILKHDDGFPLALTVGSVVVMVLVWMALLRPSVALTDRDLLLRTMAGGIRLPLAAIEDLAVRQVLAVRVGQRRYVSPAIGKPLREVARGGRVPVTETAATQYPDFVEERIRQRMDDARAALGVRRASDEQAALAAGVRRTWAWPEIVALGVSALALVLVLVMA